MKEAHQIKKYYIKIIYDTGDSFHHESDVEGVVRGISWDNVEAAKAALKRIEEHYEWYLKTREFGRFYYNSDEQKELEEEAKKAAWYSTKYPEYCIRVLDDDGKDFEISGYWTGYFETLKSAEIEINRGKDEMKYIPDPYKRRS